MAEEKDSSVVSVLGIWAQGDGDSQVLIAIEPSSLPYGFTIKPLGSITWSVGAGSMNSSKFILFTPDGEPVNFTYTLSDDNNTFNISNGVVWKKQGIQLIPNK